MYQATSNSNKVNGGNYSRLMLLPQSTTRNNRTFGNIPNASYVALFHNFDQGIDYLTFLVAFLHETRNTQFRTRNLRLNELICFFQWVDKNPQTHWHSLRRRRPNMPIRLPGGFQGRIEQDCIVCIHINIAFRRCFR